MLSILIPTYNYNVLSLASAIHAQIVKTGIPFEIICLDDASTVSFTENEKINKLPGAIYERLEKNIGRSKIRNLLAKKAQYDWLLFLDSDVFPKADNFILTYLPYLNDDKKIVNGGLLYQDKRPDQDKLLRWIYGKNREALPYKTRKKKPYLSFLTLNFLIHKSLFETVTFNENIPNLRHEDTLFSYDLMQKKIKIIHIDNPIYHLGLDAFDEMMKKENESISVLKYLLDSSFIATDYLRISKLFSLLKSLKAAGIVASSHKLMRQRLLRNLQGKSPSLFLFDVYRIGYLCSLEKN